MRAAEAASGKGHRDENFPVASHLVEARYRGPILAFYRFVRAADDVADHPTLRPDEKLSLLDALAGGLAGAVPAEPAAAELRQALAARGLSPRHALDLVEAFRLDVTKRRYADWDDLIAYCRLSAMPVGRFVLDLHGESEATWSASDPLCAALQVINHLQDCGKDFRDLDRVYIPRDAMARHRITVDALAEPRASARLKACIADLAERTLVLLEASRPLSAEVANLRLGLEIAAIQSLAEVLAKRLQRRDPLSERVHLGRAGSIGVAALGILRALGPRLVGRRLAGARA
jgi:squalene synthase HpnC